MMPCAAEISQENVKQGFYVGADAVQLIDASRKKYDAGVGCTSGVRYVTSDPIGLDGGLNTYGYVLGNPLKYSDQHGLVVTGEWDVTSPGGGVWASYQGMFSSIDSGVYRNGEVYDVNRTVWGYGVIVGQVKCTDTECGEEETWTVGPIVLEDSVTALIESGVPEEFYHFTEWKDEWKATDVVQSEIAKWKNYNPTAFCFKK